MSHKSTTSAQHKASGFSLDYACSLSVRKGRSKTHVAAKGRERQ